MKYIKSEDAIETTWTVLEMVGFSKKANEELQRRVNNVFNSVTVIDIEEPKNEVQKETGSD